MGRVRREKRFAKNERKNRAHRAKLARREEVDYGESIVLVTDPGRKWRLEARNVPKLRALLGDHLLIPFAKAFAGADHLESCHYLMKLNSDVSGIAHDRNFWTLVLTIWGTMREISVALEALRRGGIEKKVDDVDLWRDIDAIRKRWHGDDFFIQIRNQLCFHLGDSSLYKKALDEWNYPHPLPIVAGDFEDGEMFARNSRLLLGEELRLRGTGIDTEAFKKFVDASLKHHANFSDLIQRLLVSALRKAGLGMGAPPPRKRP